MKFAPLVAGSALALLVLTLATAKSISPPDKVLPLAIEGVETLEVSSDQSLMVAIDSSKPPSLKYPDRSDIHVSMRRDGSRLIVTGKFDSYGELLVTVPKQVHRFVVSGGEIVALQRQSEVEILSPRDFGWKGDADRLLLRDTADPSKHAHDGEPGHDCSCSSNTISVHEGRIGEIRAWSPHAILELGTPDTIGVVYADLGPKGSVSMSKARRFDHIHLVGAGSPAVASAPPPPPPPH